MREEIIPGIARMFRDAMPWAKDAACRDVDTSVFFPENTRGHYADYFPAKQICFHGGPDGGECSVRRACLRWAIDNHEKYGVWGGASPDERRKRRIPVGPMETNAICAYCHAPFLATARTHKYCPPCSKRGRRPKKVA